MNFFTSMGFVATSTLSRMNINGTGQSAITVNFTDLKKYELPDYTVKTSNTFNYNTSTQLFGFNRGSDVFSLRFLVYKSGNVSGSWYGYYIYIGLFKNQTPTRLDYAYQIGEMQFQWLPDSTRPFTHFYLAQPTSWSSYNNNVTLTLYDYTTKTLNGTTSYNGGFTLGFCTSNVTNNNTFNTWYNPSVNNIRICSFTIYCLNGQQSPLTNIGEYNTFIEFVCGGNVKYVGDDDNSTTGGGFGSGDTSSDTNLIPDTEDNTQFETESALLTSCNLFTTHIMSTADVQSLTSFLWDTNIITSLERLFKTNPLDVIVDFKRLPITITSTWTKDIYLGTNNTNINTQIVSKQYVTVNCGTLYPQELWGTSLDYSPHTKMMIYLPFIGFKNINVDYFMQQGITVKYIIDVLSGDFVCFLLRTAIDSNQNVIYTFNGNCAIHYPLTGTSYNSMLLSSSTIAKSTSSGFSSGGQVGAVLGAMNGVGNTIGAKPEYNMSDSYNSNMGFCGIMKPYLLIERPQQSLPSGVENYVGFPSNITETLSNLTGFTKVQDINLQVNATEEEKEEIEKLLKGGVIL